MNREIKFRAWYYDKDWPEFSYMTFVCSIDFVKQKAKIGVLENIYKFNQIKLMQYTGLKDKNGVEIYEGDIVRYYGRNAIVKIGFPHDDKLYPYGVCVEYIKYNLKEVEYLYKFNLEDIEVIGNIYQNKELLEEK